MTPSESGRIAAQARWGNRSANERFWEKVDQSTGPDGCWTWTASLHGRYGSFRVAGRHIRAHRFAYQALVGPIPVGLDLDHLCRNTRCVNPTHLEPVTHRENVIVRGTGPFADRARQTHCKRGHEFTPENTNRREGRRRCRTCDIQTGRDRYRAMRTTAW